MFECLAGRVEGLAGLSPAGWRELLASAEAHQVQPLLAHRLLSSDADIPDEIRTTLRAIERDTAERNMRRLRDLAVAVRALAGKPVIVLKGMHLLAQVYESLAVRSMIDLDLLVPSAGLAPAAAALESLGYRAVQPYRISEDAMPFFRNHLPAFTMDGITTIELHWHVALQAPGREIDVAELWQRAIPARIAGVDVRVLSPEDLLLHLCIHAAYGHRFHVSARASCDIAAVVQRGEIEWSEVVERAVRWRVAAGTYVTLRLARDLLEAPIPASVLASLEPPNFDESLLAAAIREPFEDPSITAVNFRMKRGILRKLSYVRERVFVSREAIADEYNLGRSSLRVYAWYAVRAKDLIKRHWRSVLGDYKSEDVRARMAKTEALDAMLGLRPE